MIENDKIKVLEQKIDLIMSHLGLSLPEPVVQAETKTDTSKLELELQKILNEIKVKKIKFRTTPPRSPVRQELLESIETLNGKKVILEAELSAKR